MKSCWAHKAEDRLRFHAIVDVLSRVHDRLSGQDSEYSDNCEESEEEDANLTPDATMSSSRQRPNVGSTRYFICTITQTLELKLQCLFHSWPWHVDMCYI